MDKDYNRIILPKSLDKGTSYRTAVWVANSIFARTGIPVVYGHTDEQKETTGMPVLVNIELATHTAVLYEVPLSKLFGSIILL